MQYLNVWTSVTAYVNQQLKMIVANGITPADSVQIFDWENHANIEEAPPKHLIGPASLSLEESSSGIYHTSFVIGVGSFNDDGLFIHRKMVDFLFKSIASGTRISIFDSDTKQPYSWMRIIDGTTVAPMSRSNQRALQFIQAEGLVDPAV